MQTRLCTSPRNHPLQHFQSCSGNMGSPPTRRFMNGNSHPLPLCNERMTWLRGRYRHLEDCYSRVFDEVAAQQSSSGAALFLDVWRTTFFPSFLPSSDNPHPMCRACKAATMAPRTCTCQRLASTMSLCPRRTQQWPLHSCNIFTIFPQVRPISPPLSALVTYPLSVEGDDTDSEQLQIIDYVMISLSIVALLVGIVYFSFKFFGKVLHLFSFLLLFHHCRRIFSEMQKPRRRVSFEAEKVATRTVDKLVSELPTRFLPMIFSPLSL